MNPSNFRIKIPKIFEADLQHTAIGRQFLFDAKELAFSSLDLEDPIGDESCSPIKGITHRYSDRVLLKPLMLCGVYCRYCFRKNKVAQSQHNLNEKELEAALEYIQNHQEIHEVILTGGDPLLLNDQKLLKIRQIIAQMPHIKTLRIHSRLPMVLPNRFQEAFFERLEEGQTLWMVLHINSHLEWKKENEKLLKVMRRYFPLLAQSVVLKDVNDQPETLQKLLESLITRGIKPYYLHYPDLVPGTQHLRPKLASVLKLLASLRGRIPAYALPQLVVDLPKGLGKVVLGESNYQQIEQDLWEFVSPLNGQKIQMRYPLD